MVELLGVAAHGASASFSRSNRTDDHLTGRPARWSPRADPLCSGLQARDGLNGVGAEHQRQANRPDARGEFLHGVRSNSVLVGHRHRAGVEDPSIVTM